MSWIVTLLLSVFISVGLYFIGRGLLDVSHASNSSAWPKAPATILQSEVATSRDSDNDTTYKAKITYEYTVNGNTHTSSKVFFGDGISAGSNYAQAIVARHPRGTATHAFYHPERPDLAVLEPGLTKRSFITAAFGLLFFSMGASFGLLYWLTN